MDIASVSNIISVLTPPILICWFFYSQNQSLSAKYLQEIDGIYAGFVPSQFNSQRGGTVYSGIIMNIHDVDAKGFFRGQLDYGGRESYLQNDEPQSALLFDGISHFMGKLKFNLSRDKERDPFNPKENRVYKGTLYLVSRLDFDFSNYKIEDYITAEYSIQHYREMQTLVFTLKKFINLQYFIYQLHLNYIKVWGLPSSLIRR